MSIFDQYDFLPGEKRKRKVKLEFTDYEDLNSNEEIDSKQTRPVWVFYFATLFVTLLLVGQLANLQITHGGTNRYLAEGNRVRERTITAPRGIIFDNKGNPLVNNDASFALKLFPQDLPKNEKERNEYYENLSQITQMPIDEIKNTVKEKSRLGDSITLKENIDRDTALLLETKMINVPGAVIAKEPIRNYKGTLGLAQILGYVGKVTDKELKNSDYKLDEIIGKDGLEKNYQQYLKGKDGVDLIEVDSRGRAQRLLSSRPPEPGNSLTLALDGGLEEVMADALKDSIEANDAKAGAAVAINPKTGGVLGMVSLPSYDNNLFSKGISSGDYQKLISDEKQPMFNRVISGEYPSGSTIKPLVAAAALQEGIITENTTINDPGEIRVGSWVYPDWKDHDLVDVRKALAVSCNVFFYATGGGWDKIKGLGVDKLKNYLEQFGFGKPSGIDLSGEAKGLLPSPSWKEKVKKETWYLGDTYHMAIGQGDVLATPLQMATAISAVANGGELLKPHLVSKIADKDGKQIKETPREVIKKNFIDQDNLRIVREGMRNCVNTDYGSCRAMNDLPIAVAGKTGTAQFGAEGKTHGWMVAFAPYDEPEIAIAIIVEGGGDGHSSAGPVAKKAFSWYFDHK